MFTQETKHIKIPADRIARELVKNQKKMALGMDEVDAVEYEVESHKHVYVPVSTHPDAGSVPNIFDVDMSELRAARTPREGLNSDERDSLTEDEKMDYVADVRLEVVGMVADRLKDDANRRIEVELEDRLLGMTNTKTVYLEFI